MFSYSIGRCKSNFPGRENQVAAAVVQVFPLVDDYGGDYGLRVKRDAIAQQRYLLPAAMPLTVMKR